MFQQYLATGDQPVSVLHLHNVNPVAMNSFPVVYMSGWLCTLIGNPNNSLLTTKKQI